MALEDNTVDCLIFSRDRAAQLDLLLCSIERYAPRVYRSVAVLYRSTGPDYWRGYEQLDASKPDAVLVEQVDFEFDVRRWLDEAGPVVSFLVDDDIFFREAEPPEWLPWSYRGGDYWYPFSLDGNVYQRDGVVRLIDPLAFDDPTELEARGHDRAGVIGWHPGDVHHGEPCLVGIPANRVSPSSGMPHMGVDLAELNRRYLAGERLELGSEPSGLHAHEPIDLVFA